MRSLIACHFNIKFKTEQIRKFYARLNTNLVDII